MKKTLILLSLFLTTSLQSEEDFTLDESKNQEECVETPKKKKCRHRRLSYRQGYSETEYEERLPSWPGKIDDPLIEELTR